MDREQEDVQVQKIYQMKDRKIKGRTKGRGWRQDRGGAKKGGGAKGGGGGAKGGGTANPPPMRRKPLQNKM